MSKNRAQEKWASLQPHSWDVYFPSAIFLATFKVNRLF